MMDEGELGDRDYRALAAFRFALRRFLSFSEVAATKAGLTPRQHQALLGIKGGGATGISDLAGFLIVRHNSAVELADRLASAGLVTREPDPADRRRVLLRLTAEGERRLATLSASHFAELERIGPELRALLDQMDARRDDSPEA